MSKRVKFEGEDIPLAKLPRPCGYRLLVGMLKIDGVSEGGIVLTSQHVRDQGYLRFVAKVLAVGPGAYRAPKFNDGIPLENRSPEPWAKVGDVVIIGQYSGQAVPCLDGDDAIQTLKFINDDEILGVVPDLQVLAL